MAHDVFISHSAKDKITGDAVCALLESEGIRCWIAPRDVTPGMEWSECIMDAIENARIMVLIFSSNANVSDHIRREVERAANRSIAILTLRIEDVLPAKALEFFIGNVHWLDALTPPLEAHLKKLAGTIKMLLAREEGKQLPIPPKIKEPISEPILEPKPAHNIALVPAKWLWKVSVWGWGIGIVLALLLVGFFFHRDLASRPAPAVTQQPAPPPRLNNDTWTDPATKLMWTKRDSGDNHDLTWPQAVSYCRDLSLDNRTDWRLPTIEELKKIYDPSVSEHVDCCSKLPGGAHFNVHVKGNLILTGWEWSSTRGNDPGQALGLNFYDDSTPSGFVRLAFKIDVPRALCVRSSEE
jgi:hypothetical protein